MRSRPSITLTICLLASTLAVAGLVRSGGGDPAPAGGASIAIEGFAFAEITGVEPGASVTVANLDGAPHTLTATGGAFDTGLIDGGGSVDLTVPTAAGTYSFFCELHPSMTGSLTVS